MEEKSESCRQVVVDQTDKNGEDISSGSLEDVKNQRNDKGASLESFITDHYNKQLSEGKMDPTDEIDADRTANFLSRALSESRRMNKETEKFKSKREALHAEIGKDMFREWREEHASEVLSVRDQERIGLCELP